MPSILEVKNYALTEFDSDFTIIRHGLGNYTIIFGIPQSNSYLVLLTTETIITWVGIGTT